MDAITLGHVGHVIRCRRGSNSALIRLCSRSGFGMFQAWTFRPTRGRHASIFWGLGLKFRLPMRSQGVPSLRRSIRMTPITVSYRSSLTISNLP